MAKPRVLRAALYARLSVTKDESVSIPHQLEATRKYAESQGWTVVLEAFDEGVSATRNKPEARVGWRTIADSPEAYDVV
ncbi:MAG TPA: recombinase family protein, partial [Marmoricola sp.]|nr:recombinase family protein [Marmoricola sp.]